MTRRQFIIALAFLLLISLFLVLPRTGSPRRQGKPPLYKEQKVSFDVGFNGQECEPGAATFKFATLREGTRI